MSLHYLLDGYNISNQLPVKALDNLEDQRRNLVRLIENTRPQGSLRNKVTVIFDGVSGYENTQISPIINVVFSRDESADNKIKRMVEKATQKSQMIVVTNDRDIQYSVRANGAKTMDVKTFLDQGKKKVVSRNKKPGPKEDRGKNIPKSVEFKITDEMKDIWINKKKNKKNK